MSTWGRFVAYMQTKTWLTNLETNETAFKGESEWPRHEFFYWTDDGNCAALRYNNWKISFLKQEAHGLDVWRQPFVITSGAAQNGSD